MRSNFVALAMGFVDDGAQLVHGKCGDVVEDAIVADLVGAVGVDLDPVGAVHDLLANGLAGFVGAIDNLHAVRDRHIGCIAQERVGARNIEGPGCNLHARAGNYAAIDGVADIDIGVAGAFGFEVANHGKAIVERTTSVYRTENSAVLGGLLEELGVVIGSGDVALEQDVGVGVDQ